LPPGARPFANIAQPNHLASICFLGICCLGWMHQRQQIGSATLRLGGAFFILGLVLTQSRTGLLQVGLLVAWVLAIRDRAHLRTSRRDALSLGIGLAGLSLCWPWFCDLLLLNGARSATEAQASVGLRGRHWWMMIDAIGREPWWGYGWQQLHSAQQRVALDHAWVGEHIESSHNLILDLLVWVGIPIGLTMVALLATWFLRRGLQCRNPHAAWLLVMVAGLFAHAMLEYPLEYAYFLIPIGLMMGALDGSVDAAADVRAPRAFLWGATGALALLLACIGKEYVKAEEDLRVLRFEAAHIGVDRIATPAPKLVLLTQLQAYLALGRIEARQGMEARELELAAAVAQRYGYQWVMFRYALAAGLNRQPEIAATTLARVCRVHSLRQCTDVRDRWQELANGQYPQLKSIAVPPLPMSR